MRRQRYDSDSDDDRRLQSIPSKLTLRSLAPNASISRDPTSNNFFIKPVQIIEYLTKKPELFEGDFLNLEKFRDLLGRIETTRRFETFFSSGERERSAPDFDLEGFIENEFRKMHAGRMALNPGWKFPSLIGYNQSVLSIPGRDVIDLPLYIMMYTLRRLTQFPKGQKSFIVMENVAVDIDDSNTSHIIQRKGTNHPIRVENGRIRVDDFIRIYLTLVKKFAGTLPGYDGSASWNGSEDSGTRIMLNKYLGGHRVYMRLNFIPAYSVKPGHMWTQQVEDLIKQTVGNSVLSVKNENDNKCLLYCIILGLIIKVKGETRVFGLNKLMIDPSEIYSKGMFLFSNEEDPISRLIRNLCRFILPASTFENEEDNLFDQFLSDLDKRVGTVLSLSDFREEFEKIESKIIPDNICGIDIYGIDYNINSHIYPLYISKTRENLIELLCVTPLDTYNSHFCLIINMEKLLRGSGGKQFFSCSKCGETFYHRRLLNEHKCPCALLQHSSDGGYHFSNKYADPSCDIVCGSCPKCRLDFTDDFTYQYHKEHCLMAGQTGYRHVQLITYKKDEHPTLNGEEIDLEAENDHVKRRRVIYADFESSINPENGEHSFMSYGAYDWKGDVYKCGYSLEEFMNFILGIAYGNKEDHIYIYFHNAMGYDANFILRFVLRHSEYKKWGIQVIMKSSNRLQKLVFHTTKEGKTRQIHIGDTFLFLTLSLERIVDSIRKDNVEVNEGNFPNFFQIFKRRYPFVSDEEIDHVLRKNIFPYKFFTSSEKLDTPISEFLKIFEPKEENIKFFSEKVTVEDLEEGFADTRHIVETFKCKDARDYHDLYLCCDVMQLADVFDRCLNIFWESHHIHLTKYLGMPSASWAAFLRHDPKLCIPLYEDTFFAEFFKGMIRGGITSAVLRHAVADENHSIIYLDVNGLYPYVMQKYDFPCGHFDFIPLGWSGEIVNIKLKEYFEMFEKEHKGMCFCVDMHIPDEVKKVTDMYPFAPEHRRIYNEYFTNPDTKEMTPFLKKWSEANDGEQMKEFTGLVCTLYDKQKYNVHWRLLKFYMEHGVQIKRVLFGVLFDEGDYLAGYIRKNIEIRNGRKDELGKTAYKLLGNAIYGKTFESPFKRATYEIIDDKIKLQGLIEEGNIAAVLPIDDLGWIIKMDGEDIILDKPTYIGSCVCEFAKLHMYTLLYDELSPLFPGTEDDPGCQLVYTDTDSFIVKLRHPEGVTSDPKTLFDYIKKHNPGLIGGIGGQVKSETGENDTIKEIVALRSKVYAYITTSGHEDRRAKGTTHATQAQLELEQYRNVLLSHKSLVTHNAQFKRQRFMIASMDVERQSLSDNDGKRYICDDGVHTHAFGFPL